MSQRPPRNVEAGALIADRYRLEAPIGRGAMGSVWRALHVRLDAPVAIKLLNASIADEPVMVERFMREARAAAAVRSSHVVKIFDYGMDDGAPYIAMELLVGETLDARLEACGSLPAPELDRIFGEIARAVGVAHELGVVHRDIKPANIFLAREGEHDVTKVLDFGIAKLMGRRLEAPAARATETGILLGTPHYMSPEQARGHRQVDQRADLWALAVLAFECLTGRHPFESETLGDLVVKICTGAPPLPSAVAELPVAFDRWFLRGVSKEPEDRFGSAAEMASELHALLAAEKLGAASRPRSQPAPRRLELIGTEVIPGTTSRGAPPTEREPPTAEAGPSLNATAVAAEVLPRSRPARRRQLAVAALALSAPLLALVLTLSRRASPPPSPAPASAAARVDLAEPAGVAAPETRAVAPESADASRGAGAGSSGAPDQSLGAGGASAMGARDETPRASGAAGSSGEPRAGGTRNEASAPAKGRNREHSSATALTLGPSSATLAAPSSPSRNPRHSPQSAAETAAERTVARPAPPGPAAVEVSPAPASVPPSAADPYADRL